MAPSRCRIAFLALTFGVSMALMELVCEAMSRNVVGLDAPTMGLCITLAQFAGCFVVARFGGGRLLTSWKDISTFTWMSLIPYARLSFLIFCGTGLANIAIGYVQYPVKVVFKSSKLVPVMIVSVIMGNSKPFRWKEYVGAVLICLGTAGFAWKPGKDDEHAEMAILGVGLLCLAVLADAFSSNFQQKMMQREDVDPMTLMARLNFVGLVGLIIGQIFSGNASQIYVAAGVDLKIFVYMAGVGITIGLGVWANTNLINEAGSVCAMTVATLRKVVTMLLSYIVFPKPLSRIHIVAAVSVFTGIALTDLFKTATKDRPEPDQIASKDEEMHARKDRKDDVSLSTHAASTNSPIPFLQVESLVDPVPSVHPRKNEAGVVREGEP